MKNLFRYLSILLIIVTVSCNKEESSEIANQASLEAKNTSQVISIMDTYHSGNYEYVNELFLTDDHNTFTVYEYSLLSSNEDVFITIDQIEPENNFYLEINWDESIYTSINLQTEESDTFAFDESFSPVQGEVLIEAMNSFNQTEGLFGGRFWGWQCGGSYEVDLSGNRYRNCCYRIFWRDRFCRVVQVGDEPGRNPRITAP